MKLFISILSASLAASLFAATYLPEASKANLFVSPLAKGEVAVIPVADGSAELYVGDETQFARRVSDSSALRGTRHRSLSPNEFAVVASSNVSYNASSSTYTWSVSSTNEFATFDAVMKDNNRVVSFLIDYSAKRTDGGLGDPQFEQKTSRVGNSISTRFRMVTPVTGILTVTAFHIEVQDVGEYDTTNDLTKVDFHMIDRLGKFNLNDLRYWTKHLYDGNRGEDWSKYPASSSIDLQDHRLYLDSARRFALTRLDATDPGLVLSSLGEPLMTILSPTSSPTNDTSKLRITAIDNSNNVRLTFSQSIASFNASNLEVLYSLDLTDTFDVLDRSRFSISGSTITISSPPSTERCFYKLRYGSLVSDSASINFSCPVTFRNALIIKGDNGSLYRIRVNSSGQLSASLIN